MHVSKHKLGSLRIVDASVGQCGWEEAGMTVECYNNTLRSVLDKHAPVRARHLKSQSRPPWFNDEIVKVRRERQSAERKWRASRLNSDLDVFKAKRNFALHVMNESRRAYYKQYINENSSDQGRLFRASECLLNFHVDRALPPHLGARMLANEMVEYFVHKITAIRSELDADASGATFFATSTLTCSEFSEFSPLSEESVRRIAASCAKSCALDPVPSSILSVWMNCSLLLGKLSTCLLSLASLQRTGKML